MARLPQTGSDAGRWGDILNEYLLQTHSEDGSLRNDTVGAGQLKPQSVTNAALADGTIQEAKLSSAVAAKLNTPATIADNSISREKLQGVGSSNGIAPLNVEAQIDEVHLPERLSDQAITSSITEMTAIYNGAATFGEARGPVNWSEATTILTKAAMLAASGKTTFYWPFVVDTHNRFPDAPARFLAYWSTDHDATTGAVTMAYAQHPAGPWTIHGNVYYDAVEGDQTETPTVVLRETDLIMYYQQRGAGTGTQSTLYATSTDGITWTRQGFAFQKLSAGLPNDGHHGYARVYRLWKHRWIAYTLFSGTDYSRQAIWYSSDGEKWMLDRRLLVNNVDMTGENRLRVSMSPPVFYWRNELWAGANIKTPSSGGVGAAVSEWYMARLAPDLRSFVGEWIPSVVPNSIIEYEGILYGYGLSGTGLTVRTQGA